MGSAEPRKYTTAEEINELALRYFADAEKLPLGGARQAVLREAIQLLASAERMSAPERSPLSH